MELKPGEFNGPVVIDNPVTIVGNNTTVWGKRGPVIKVSQRGVVIKNILVEVTGDQAHQYQQVAIETDPKYGTIIENVAVKGRVVGFGAESGGWDYPYSLNFGTLPYGVPISYKMKLFVPVACRIESMISGISFMPSEIEPGLSEVTVNIQPLVQNSILCGSFQLVSKFIRRISVSGLANGAKNNELVNGQIIWSPGSVPPGITTTAHTVQERPTPSIHTKPIYTDTIQNNTIQTNTSAAGNLQNMTRLQKGHRVDLVHEGENPKLILGLGWQCRASENFEVDVVAFLLGDNGKVLKDEDFIFYGNKRSVEGGVELLGPNLGVREQIAIDVANISSEHNKLVIALSIYEGKERHQGFAQMSQVFVKVRDLSSGQDLYVYEMSQRAALETTLISVEIYRHKGKWKMAAVGSGYRENLAYLCRKYGVEVS